MQVSHSSKFKELFSFYEGFFSVFGMTESKLHKLRKIIASRSDEDAITEDFNKVGIDIRKSMNNHDKEGKLPELLCE